MPSIEGYVQRLKWNGPLQAVFVYVGPDPTNTSIFYVLFASWDTPADLATKRNAVYALTQAQVWGHPVVVVHATSSVEIESVSLPAFYAERDVQVSFDTSTNNARSESYLVADPRDPHHLVGASKRFTDPVNYVFSIATYVSRNAGATWTESTPPAPPPNTTGISDPALAFDDVGDVYLAGLPYKITGQNQISLPGMAFYKSTDGGATWSGPNPFLALNGSDKQDIAGDPVSGRVYAAWDAPGGLAFARTLDRGASWIGPGATAAGTTIPGVTSSFAPSLAVASDGTLYIAFVDATGLRVVKSTDGGQTFVTTLPYAATGVRLITSIPGAKFRTPGVPCACVGKAGTLLVTWADVREGPARIYYARTTDGGATWASASGAPLLRSHPVPASQHDFHPQLASTSGLIGCAFYRYGPKQPTATTPGRIDVITVASGDDGASFSAMATATDQPWDPTIDAPFADANPNVTFIGDYFGFDGNSLGWFPFFTDTRTGIQEIWTSLVHFE